MRDASEERVSCRSRDSSSSVAALLLLLLLLLLQLAVTCTLCDPTAEKTTSTDAPVRDRVEEEAAEEEEAEEEAAAAVAPSMVHAYAQPLPEDESDESTTERVVRARGSTSVPTVSHGRSFPTKASYCVSGREGGGGGEKETRGAREVEENKLN